MPGKVNPVMCEVALQVSAQVIGNDAAITVGGLQGQFELNVRIPLIARNLLQSIKLLANTSRLFAEKCVDGIEANLAGCERSAESTLATATALNPYIGYDKGAEIVKEATAPGAPARGRARGRASRSPCWRRRSTCAESRGERVTSLAGLRLWWPEGETASGRELSATGRRRDTAGRWGSGPPTSR